MLARASSTPWHKPPVNGRDPYLNTMGFPLFFVSSNSVPFAVALHIGHRPEPLVKVSNSVQRYGGHKIAPGLPIAILSTLSQQLSVAIRCSLAAERDIPVVQNDKHALVDWRPSAYAHICVLQAALCRDYLLLSHILHAAALPWSMSICIHEKCAHNGTV